MSISPTMRKYAAQSGANRAESRRNVPSVAGTQPVLAGQFASVLVRRALDPRGILDALWSTASKPCVESHFEIASGRRISQQ